MKNRNNIEADVIILGCSLPGIVTAHKLKKRFGKTMDIVVLDLSSQKKTVSKGNVAFKEHDRQESQDSMESSSRMEKSGTQLVNKVNNVTIEYFQSLAKEFKVPLPDVIIDPERSHLNKVFQYLDGSTVLCTSDYHEFDYLNIMERFELNQYLNLLSQNARDLCQSRRFRSETDKKTLIYYDKTTMEQHLCSSLLFSTSREIMRATVRLVCGTPSHSVSVLFYLHQSYRSGSAGSHLFGHDTRFREKILGYCRKHFSHNLQKSVADITVPAIPIQKIRAYANEQVILETIKGDTNYICNLLAMALKPDELVKIAVEEQFLSDREAEVVSAMRQGKVKRFKIKYEQNFLEEQGFSGDILSIRGPIVWAMEKPQLSATGCEHKFAGIVGYLIVKDDDSDSKDAVVEQLTKLFGTEAANPAFYAEKDIDDVFVPRCGDYVALRNLTSSIKPSNIVEWAALDVFGDGDVAAALEAGHNAYLHLLTSLRPQALAFEDLKVNARAVLDRGPFERWYSELNYITSAKLIVYAAAIAVGLKLLRSYMKK